MKPSPYRWMVPETGAVVKIAARSGARRDGDIAMAIFAGYIIGNSFRCFIEECVQP